MEASLGIISMAPTTAGKFLLSMHTSCSHLTSQSDLKPILPQLVNLPSNASGTPSALSLMWPILNYRVTLWAQLCPALGSSVPQSLLELKSPRKLALSRISRLTMANILLWSTDTGMTGYMMSDQSWCTWLNAQVRAVAWIHRKLIG